MNVMPLQGDLALPILGLGILLSIIVVGSQSVEIVPAYENSVLTVFGQYRRVLDPGINVVLPFVSQTHSFDMRTQQLDMPRQTVSTRDGVTVTADAEIFIRVTDAIKVFFGVDNYKQSVSNLAQTTLREVLDDMDFGDVDLDDMDPDERQTLVDEIRTRTVEEYERHEEYKELLYTPPSDWDDEKVETMMTELNTRNMGKYAAIDDGLKQRMEITRSLKIRVREELDTTTDGWGVEVMDVEVANLTLNSDAQNERDQHRASSPGDDPRRTE